MMFVDPIGFSLLHMLTFLKHANGLRCFIGSLEESDPFMSHECTSANKFCYSAYCSNSLSVGDEDNDYQTSILNTPTFVKNCATTETICAHMDIGCASAGRMSNSSEFKHHCYMCTGDNCNENNATLPMTHNPSHGSTGRVRINNKGTGLQERRGSTIRGELGSTTKARIFTKGKGQQRGRGSSRKARVNKKNMKKNGATPKPD